MKLQEKTSLILVVLLIFSITLISIFVSALSLSSSHALETSYLDREIRHATGVIDEDARTLAATVSDYAAWDDTCAFIEGDQPGYPESNLLPQTFTNLRLNLIVIADTSGNIIFGKTSNFAQETLSPLPESFRDHIRPGMPLLDMSSPQAGVEGILNTPDGPMVIASRPIVRTDFSGTPRGVVIMGRYLAPQDPALPSLLTDPSLRILTLDDPGIPSGILEELKVQESNNPRITRALSATEAEGYTLIRDIYGNDAAILRIIQYRDIFQQGLKNTLQYILIVLAAGLLLGVAALFMLDRLILSRIMDLSRQVSGIGNRAGIADRVCLAGNDEFADLAQKINRMLDTIEKTQNGLQASENRFRDLAELLPQIIFDMDRDGRLLYVNHAGADLLGITEERIRNGTNITEFLVPDDVGRMQQGVKKVIGGGVTAAGEVFSFCRADKTFMRAIVFTAPVHRDNQIIGLRGVIADITDRLKLEEALIESQEYLQSLLWSVRAGIMVIDATTHTIIDANPAALEMIGTTTDQLVNQSCHTVLCIDEPEQCPVTDNGHIIENMETTLRTRDGRTISVIRYIVPVTLQGRSCLLETFIDNTPRKQIEQELTMSRERLSGILHASPVGVFETAGDGTLAYVNERWEEMTGLPLHGMDGRRWTEILHPEDRGRVEREFAQKIQQRGVLKAEARFIRPDKTVIWVFIQAVPLYDADRAIRGFAGTITDITDRKRDEEAIQLANKKLNLMNNITRHDILNTITGLLGCVDMAKATRMDDERLALLNEIKDLVRVIQRQIAFTREYQEVGVRLPVWQNVNEVITRTRENFRSFDLSIVIDLQNMEIYADPLLEKVFYNLVDNAIRYGDTITMISFFFQISDKGLSIICQDDGAGIDPKAKERIFERGVGRNTGMGLFLTREILGITGITIQENGVFGKGARFEILIPRGTFRFIRE